MTKPQRFRRTCEECGSDFIGPADKRFCIPAHKTAFHNRMKARGQTLVPLVMAWRGARSRRGDEVGAYAFAQLCRLADLWAEEDSRAGRESGAREVKRKLREGWLAVDLPSLAAPRAKAAPEPS